MTTTQARESHVLNRASNDGTIAGLARAILEPLCEETAQLLRPVQLSPHDRLKIDLDETGRMFVARPYGRYIEPPNPKVQAALEAFERGDVNDAGARAMLALVNVALPEGIDFPAWAAQQEADRIKRASFVSASHAARSKWFENVPEKEDLGNGSWELAATDITSLIINANWPDSRVDWQPEAKAIHNFLLTRFLKQTLNSHHRANYKLKGVLPPMPADYADHPDKPLANYQKVAFVGALDQDGSAFFAEQGTGKTAPAIARICVEAERHYRKEQLRIAVHGGKRKLYTGIIVCPKNVRYNWVNEFMSFATCPGKINVLRGGKMKRMKQWMETIIADDDSRFGIVVISYESVKRSWSFLGAMRWDIALLDESHYIKSVHRDRGKSMLMLRDQSEQRMVLTGTPITNTVMDVYMQLEFLGEGMSGFQKWENFKKFYGHFEREGNSQYEKLVGYQNLPFLKERLARIAFQITKKEALPNLPPKLSRIVEVEMTSQQRNYYVRMQSQLAVEIESGMNSNGKRMTAQHILVKLLRLAQITSGFVSWDAQLDPETGDIVQGSAIEAMTPNPKIEALIEDVKALGADEKALVWACFIPDINAICERLTQEGIPHVRFTGSTSDDERLEAERRFNCEPASKCKLFVGNPAAGGTGLNLRGYNPDSDRPDVTILGKTAAQDRHCMVERRITVQDGLKVLTHASLTDVEPDHGCDCTTVYYFSQNWSMVHRNQSEDRAHRRGTRRPVTYVDLVIPGTIDEEIRARVVGKTLSAMSAQDVREVMHRILETIPDEDDE